MKLPPKSLRGPNPNQPPTRPGPKLPPQLKTLLDRQGMPLPSLSKLRQQRK